jgi:hypothetical protein
LKTFHPEARIWVVDWAIKFPIWEVAALSA